MRTKTLLLIPLLSGCLNLQAQIVTSANFTSLSGEAKAAAVSVTLTGTLTTTGNSDFRQLRDLAWQMTSLNLESATCSAIPNNALHSRPRLQTLVLPRAVTSIGMESFFKCTALKGTVTFPQSTHTIGYSAFANCSSLEGITFQGNSVTYIASYAFANCSLLSGTLTLPTSLRTLHSGTFQNCSSLTGVELPDGLQDIQDAVFAGCSKLKGKLNLGREIAVIGASAFEGCSSLDKPLSLPRALQTLGASAFRGCKQLPGSVVLPSTLTTLGEGAFADCASIGSLEIPESLTNIPVAAFKGCGSLTKITNYSTTPQTIAATSFDGVDQAHCLLIVPTGSGSKYRAADGWKQFKIQEQTLTGIDKKTTTVPFVAARDGKLFVNDATPGTSFTLYTASGQMIAHKTLNRPTYSISLPAQGVYLVRIGQKEYKISN